MNEFERTRNRHLLYLEAAGGVISQYLERNYFDSKTESKFLGSNEVDANGIIWFGFPLRVLLIGETVFLLRNSTGFREICYRLRDRDFRSSYYEMIAARFFFKRGFDIIMKPDASAGKTQKIRGENFDFTAKRGRLLINVEVTAFQDKTRNENTVINTLRNKRTQLPRDNPSVLYCFLPQSWEGEREFDFNGWVANAANEFFLSGSRRINRIVFSLERFIAGPTTEAGGGFIFVTNYFDNPNPYIPSNLGGIFDDRGISSVLGQLSIEDSLDEGRGPDLSRRMRTSEFYQWVDSFHDE